MATLVGQKLGKYELIERLGRGGMAEVYKAYQPRLDRFVAVKVIGCDSPRHQAGQRAVRRPLQRTSGAYRFRHCPPDW